MTPEMYWDKFIKETKRDASIRYIDCFHFELTEGLANELLELVLQGIKNATSSSLIAYEVTGERIPQAGDLSIVTNWRGEPKCIIETTSITIIPFEDITYDLCKREGEDDDLESWQKGHTTFFKNEGIQLGYEFSIDMPVVFEDFKVIYK